MTINQTFQNWKLITDEPGEQLVFEHRETDKRITLDVDGSVTSSAVKLGEDAARAIQYDAELGSLVVVD